MPARKVLAIKQSMNGENGDTLRLTIFEKNYGALSRMRRLFNKRSKMEFEAIPVLVSHIHMGKRKCVPVYMNNGTIKELVKHTKKIALIENKDVIAKNIEKEIESSKTNNGNAKPLTISDAKKKVEENFLRDLKTNRSLGEVEFIFLTPFVNVHNVCNSKIFLNYSIETGKDQSLNTYRYSITIDGGKYYLS